MTNARVDELNQRLKELEQEYNEHDYNVRYLHDQLAGIEDEIEEEEDLRRDALREMDEIEAELSKLEEQ